uniref:Putative serine/threonine-protein kinase kinX n=1 Tax=Davidia involucrata TaxID=16924 RepID=A0A5B7A9M8_DAVIN
MGGCASKPTDLDSGKEPLPREAPDTPKKANEAETTLPQENNSGGEIKKEEPLVDLSEPAQEAPKSEVPSSESKTAEEAEAVSGESKVTAKPTEEDKVVEAANETKEPIKEEEKKEVAVAVAAPSSEDKSDAPLVTM